jgi:two-component system osmolarity sensor histidine kinase EnvZ
MMTDQSLQAGMRQDVDDIERILKQFIDFARGDVDEPAYPLDPAELAHSVCARYARSGIEVTLKLAPDLPLMVARPLALMRALCNLIDNAVQYGAPPIRLVIRVVGAELEIEVADAGTGIDGADLEAARMPFQRLGRARTADGGSGLGLAIVERVARLHGGALTLGRAEEGGLSACLSLPIKPPQAA